ncbi:hypothetical protein [Vibrio scophthalmi]|uniref:Uncharacterized protein n=1 Tax=Vibrio scophthalmi LMG 19158 TaxID=870967 RepID=F9RP45_9VIBR|nr:hypothetical protein [Vibrio scophthalmi]EGU36152.1 hypothetical protein VIS19158_10354 [Vibrio scophthalmi LMG 19158]
MNTLFNKDNSMVPERPDVDNEDVKDIFIKQAVEDLFAERDCGFTEHEKPMLIESLMRHWEEHCDEYELAKDFERDGWAVDYDFVTQLENACGYVNAALKAHIDEWANSNDIAPPYEIGTQLDIGVITGVSEYEPATYRVLVHGEPEHSTSRRLIKFEDARLQ